MQRFTDHLKMPTLVAAGGFLAVAIIVVLFSSSSGCGWDDGPFYGSVLPTSSSQVLANPTYSFSNRAFILEIHNRSVDEFPIIVLIQGDRVRWISELRTDVDPHQNSAFWKIEAPHLKRGLFRTTLRFIGHWTYGAERGRAWFNARRFGAFCLSW